MITLGASSLPPDLLPPLILPCTDLQVGHFTPLHMNEFCLTMFRTLLSSTVLQTKQHVQNREYMWMDGWSQIQNPSKAWLLSFFLSSILICCRLPFPHSHYVLLWIINTVTSPPGNDGEMETERPTERRTVGWKYRKKKTLMAAYGPPLYRFIICGVVQDISQLCLPWTVPWVLGGIAEDCRCDYLFTNPPPLATWTPLLPKKKKKIHPIFFFSIRPVTLLIT